LEGLCGGTLSRVSGGIDGDYALQVAGPDILAGSFGVNDSPDWVRPTTAAGRRYRYTAWVLSPSSTGHAKLRVTEYLIATAGTNLGRVSSASVRLSPTWQKLAVDYVTVSAGSTLDFRVRDLPVVPGEVFLTDNISIRDITTLGLEPAIGEPDSAEDDEIPLQPTLHPSPIRSSAVLSFATSRPGPLRVEILDLAGRLVRRPLDEIDAPAGPHVVMIGRAIDEGRRLSPGVYFYRIQATEGVRTGRFVMLR